MASVRKKSVKDGLHGEDLKQSHERTEGLLGAHHQKNEEDSQSSLVKGEQDVTESRKELYRQVAAFDAKQRAQDQAREKHNQMQGSQKEEMSLLKKVHRDIEDEDTKVE